MYYSGMQGTYTEPALMAAMEELAVRAQNKLVNKVSHQLALQLHDDPRVTST